MADNISPSERSEIMSRVPSKGSRPELFVRRIVWELGYHYRLNAKDIPGKPDIYFKGRKRAIFINGCFWHRHEGCSLTRTPKTRVEFWSEKFRQNVARDVTNYKKLEEMGWKYLVIWECEIKQKNTQMLKEKIRLFMSDEEIAD